MRKGTDTKNLNIWLIHQFQHNIHVSAKPPNIEEIYHTHINIRTSD